MEGVMSDMLSNISKDRPNKENVVEEVVIKRSSGDASRVSSEMQAYYDNMINYNLELPEVKAALDDAFNWTIDKGIVNKDEYDCIVGEVLCAHKVNTPAISKRAAGEQEQDKYDYVAHRNVTEAEGPQSMPPNKHHVPEYQDTYAPSLSTRYCPDHIGTQLARVADGIKQCPIDHKVYNYNDGFKDERGNDYPGGSVSGQTPDSTTYGLSMRIFENN
jgi:hypothetical protein